ncbi:hypothetical protein BE17_44715 [Sorangium cellulosum]|uniref:Uncharacterized protein n=1 Tax=Sorangium cellulosum TaxID=56 RepID=A0A150RQ87_SORCE|nr:hypothetical protein BE17_44715 [Sorangium cellulosum]
MRVGGKGGRGADRALRRIGEKNSALLRGAIDAVGHTADSAVTSASAGVGTESAPGQLLDTVRRANDVWLKAGITKKPVEPASVIDFASVNRAAKEKR